MKKNTQIIEAKAQTLISKAELTFNGQQSTVLELHKLAVKSAKSAKTKFKFSPINTRKGSKWITPEKRAAFYVAAGFTCCYCGEKYDYQHLSLDHVITRETNGQVRQYLSVTSNKILAEQMEFVKSAKNATGNIVCACQDCNGDRDTKPFEEYLAEKVIEHLRAGFSNGKISDKAIEKAKKCLSLAKAQLLMTDRVLKPHKKAFKAAMAMHEDKSGQYIMMGETEHSKQRYAALNQLKAEG